MTDTTQWAQDRAREWFKRWQQDLSGYSYALSHNDWLEISGDEVASLAALLVEVGRREWDLGHSAAINVMSGHRPECSGVNLSEQRCECGWLESRAGTEATARADVLAEVRRVVEETRLAARKFGGTIGTAQEHCCDEILSRLEALK